MPQNDLVTLQNKAMKASLAAVSSAVAPIDEQRAEMAAEQKTKTTASERLFFANSLTNLISSVKNRSKFTSRYRGNNRVSKGPRPNSQ